MALLSESGGPMAFSATRRAQTRSFASPGFRAMGVSFLFTSRFGPMTLPVFFMISIILALLITDGEINKSTSASGDDRSCNNSSWHDRSCRSPCHTLWQDNVCGSAHPALQKSCVVVIIDKWALEPLACSLSSPASAAISL